MAAVYLRRYGSSNLYVPTSSLSFHNSLARQDDLITPQWNLLAKPEGEDLFSKQAVVSPPQKTSSLRIYPSDYNNKKIKI